MFDVVGVGASSLDLVYQLPATPVPDSPTAKLRISRHVLSPGGQTATAMCTCAAFGLQARFIGTVGTDAHATRIVEALNARGVDTRCVIRRDAPSPYAVILVDAQHGERVVLWDRDARLALRPEDIQADDLRGARIVHVDDVDVAAALQAARLGRALGARVTSDIDQVGPDTRRLVEAVDVAIFAEHVPMALEPRDTLEASLRALQCRDDQVLCVTLGVRGAMMLAGGTVYSAPAFRVDAVDTTGSGDVFRGAFIAALLEGRSPDDILRRANAAAAVSCTRLGAIGGVPTPAEAAAVLEGAVQL